MKITSYRYGRPLTERKVWVFQRLAEPFLFDLDKRMIEEVQAQFGLDRLMASLQGLGEEEARQKFGTMGRQLMRQIIELADGRYLDRTAQVIEAVAREIGISFPHRLQRYAELSILSLRPLDRWSVPKSTTRELAIQVRQCAVFDAMAKSGHSYPGLPCQALCLESFGMAAQKTGDAVRLAATEQLPTDGKCEFSFVLTG